MASHAEVSIHADPAGQLDPQSLAVQSVSVLIGSLLFIAGKLPETLGDFVASNLDPHFVVESLVENAGGAALVLARRIDDLDFLVRDGSLLNGVPIAAANIPRALNAVGAARTDLWGFFLKAAGDLPRFTIGQTVKLQQTDTAMEHE